MMNLPFFDDEMTGYIDVNNLSATFFYKKANSSRMTQLHEKPRAASDDEANALIDDMLANVISPLLKTRHADFNQCGRYSYPISIRLSNSRAVAALFARIIIFFSGKNVANQSEYMQYIVDFPCYLPLTHITLLLSTKNLRNSF